MAVPLGLSDAPDQAPTAAPAAPPTVDGAVAAVGALIEMMGRGGITELDLAFGELSIHLRGHGAAVAASLAAAMPVATDLPTVPSPFVDEQPRAAGHVVPAPMIGTFYGSPSPSEPPFVEVGDVVAAGQTIGIIEAMKIMNEIAADQGGVVAEILVANGQAVEYGSPLVRLLPAPDTA
jgi:acetyl-CoA carboxylase biotin carboxyl carrier protein